MRAVCREAELSQKFFYESFADVDALLHAVYAATTVRLADATATAASNDDLHGVIDAAARLMENDPRVCRILLVEPVADLRLRRHVRETVPALAKSVLAGRVDADPDDPATKMVFSAVLGALISLFVEWTEGNLGDDRDAFVRHTVGVVSKLLGRSVSRTG